MIRTTFALLLLTAAANAFAADDLKVLPDQLADGPPKQMLRRYLKAQTEAAFARRQAAYEQLKTPEDVAAYQAKIRALLLQQLGERPERTPLNPRVVGELKGAGYRAEKVIFESQPQHFVTAVIFLPTTKGPFPAVLVPAGHSQDGKVSNQRVCILLAMNGIAAMCYDPIGQGERIQIIDEKGKPLFKMTEEHTLLGSTSMLLGRGTASYRIWDGMRALDYLASRDDIDAKRLGVTGCSGGGTLSSYLMALDQRVLCAAPSCYITSFPRLLATIGPQDAEQNIHAQIALGIDHAEYLLLRAPRPTLILASTHDFFDIQGTWDTFRQAKRVYTRLGHPEAVSLIETDAKHGYPLLQREAMAHWMNRWLLEKDQPISEAQFTTPSEAAARCTPAGQVMLRPGARSVTDLNAELDDRLKPQREKIWQKENLPQALTKVRAIAGIRPLKELPQPAIRQGEAQQGVGYSIEKLVIEPEANLAIPALWLKPEKFSGKKYLYVSGVGKQSAIADEQILKLVRSGHLVLAIDVRGCGETGPAPEGLWGGDWNDIFVSYLLGRSLLGMRAEDILVAAQHLSESGEKSEVHLIGVGVCGPPALHAAAVERDLFAGLELRGSSVSWSDYVRHPERPGQLVNSVHGALRAYDLPDLLRSLPYPAIVRE
ncbi:acetylxylan esterase [Anatilimnocola floriformis]|uniref:acetylxylan esterase n=1 Tax=Anatilimnocola floriformis TaxID=2948575 RepID=UPI0020C27094|nr:acetylxylan esterase [Anatilimnocola floriformis]